MKIICIGYFDKNSRFFLDIKNQIEHNADVTCKLKVYSIYLSGFLFTLLRFRYSCWLPIRAWLLVQRKKRFYNQILSQSEDYNGIEYNDLISFHLKLDQSIPKINLQLQALAYIDIFESVFNTYNPNLLLTIGDSRLSFEIAIAIAKRRGIKVNYLEQGPFNTTFFDHKGVNANLSIRNDFECKKIVSIENTSFSFSEKLIKYNRSPFYRGLDFILKSIFESTYLYPPDIKNTDIYSYKNRTSKLKSNHNNLINKNILLIFQVPADVNMICHSPFFNTHLEMLKSVFNNLPEGYNLTVREHPLYINKYETDVYAFIQNNAINIENDIRLSNAINQSCCVIVNNSTVGIEAILRKKPVVVLGNAFYDNNYICYKYTKSTTIKDLIISAISKHINEDCIRHFENQLFETSVVFGAMDEKQLRASKTIANKIIALKL